MMVKRYDVGEYDEGGGNMISYEDESASGSWVKYSDHEAEVERLETMVRWARADSEALNIENKRYREALEEIAEIYAGMEGFIAETAPEGYQQRIIEQMYNAAKAALGGDKDVK